MRARDAIESMLSEFGFDPSFPLVVPFGLVMCHRKNILTRNPNPGFIGAMRTKTFGLILAVCFLSAGACFADPYKGTWKLDAAKSKLGKGTGRNNVVNYEFEFPGLRTKVLIDGVDASGHAFHSAWEGRFDGKERPVTGDPMSDSRSYTKVNENTLDFTAKKAGKVVATGRIVVAADEKTRTVTSWSTNSRGKKVKSIAFYNKS